MQIACPNCSVQLELPDGLPEDQHLQCPNCNKMFTLHAGATTPMPIPGTVHAVADNSSVKLPGLTLTAFIIFYAILGLLVLGSLGNLPETMPVILGGLCAIAFTLVSHFGKNWARITLTSLLGAGVLIGLGGENPEEALGVMFVLATPVVFLWLPCSNRWFRAKKAASKGSLK